MLIKHFFFSNDDSKGTSSIRSGQRLKAQQDFLSLLLKVNKQPNNPEIYKAIETHPYIKGDIAVYLNFQTKSFCFTVSNLVLRKLRSFVQHRKETLESRSQRRSTNARLSIAWKERLKEMIALRIYSVIFSSVFGGRMSFEMAEYGRLELVFRDSH